MTCCIPICFHEQCVDYNIKLCKQLSWTRFPLSQLECKRLYDMARRQVTRRNAHMSHMTEFKISRENFNNYIGIRLKREYTHMIHSYTKNGVLFAFMPSEKLEPVITVVALHECHGRLDSLNYTQIGDLKTAVVDFKSKMGLQGDTFLYTVQKSRIQSGPIRQRPHSAHFHLKITVSPSEYVTMMPAASCLSETIKCMYSEIDCMCYHFRRPSLRWDEVEQILLSEMP